MVRILHIETSTTMCSVSVAENGKVLAFKEINEGFTHAENLHVFVKEILEKSGITLNGLSAIAVSKGPGSYTGLRIGVSAAKGLAYALNLPLISIDTLQLMACQAFESKKEKIKYCAMLDARRMEVYTRVYDHELQPQTDTEALIVDEASILKYKSHSKIYFFGDGMPKCRALLSTLGNSEFAEDIVPSARHMSQLAFKKYREASFEDVAYFEPFYLKDFMILKKKGSV